MPTREERFWSKVDVGLCWEWTGAYSSGYGYFWTGEKVTPAHRVAWEWLVGPIPEGHHIDHLCRNRRCVCPDHLQPVLPDTNIGRGMDARRVAHRAGTCTKGHPVNAETGYRMGVYADGSPKYRCKVCWRLKEQRRRARRKQG